MGLEPIKKEQQSNEGPVDVYPIYRCMSYLQNNKGCTGSVHTPKECTNIIVISAYRKIMH